MDITPPVTVGVVEGLSRRDPFLVRRSNRSKPSVLIGAWLVTPVSVPYETDRSGPRMREGTSPPLLGVTPSLPTEGVWVRPLPTLHPSFLFFFRVPFFRKEDGFDSEALL